MQIPRSIKGRGPSTGRISIDTSFTTASPNSSPQSAILPSYRESIQQPNACTRCVHQATLPASATRAVSSPVPDIFLHPRPAPPIPLKAKARSDLQSSLHDLEACIAQIEPSKGEAPLRANEVYHSKRNQEDKSKLSKIRKRIIILLLLNLFGITLLAVAWYIGTTSRSTAKSSVYWCNFINALPKAVISAAFVFTIAVFGLTPFAQRLLAGRFWTQFLYVVFLFQMGGIIGALNHPIEVTLVVCPG